MRLFAALALLASFEAWAIDQCAPKDAGTGGDPTRDQLSKTRLLRRVVLGLSGTTPTDTQYAELLAKPTAAEQSAYVDSTLEALLGSPRFYERMVDFGHDWMPVGAFGIGGDAYQMSMAGHLFTCGGSTAHPGALFHQGEYPGGSNANICDDKDGAGAAITPIVNQVEPWWAPGTMVTVIGKAGTTTATVTINGQTKDCGIASGGYYDPVLPPGCGCGPGLSWCAPFSGLNGRSNTSEKLQSRHPYEEPARLFAHLVWHDRPLSDLVTGDYTVATNMLRALYVRMARMGGQSQIDQNTTWWLPASDPSPRDPLHPTPNDLLAWREVKMSALNPLLISDRSYQFDPRTTTDAPAGLPAAGVLTMMGSMYAFPRERVRAARWMETFACQSFQPPPADQHFPPYSADPATSGTCLHCHRTIDPAAIFFKRWDYSRRDSYYVPWPLIPGVGPWRVTPAMLSGQYPYQDGAEFRWRTAFNPETILTPVTAAQIAANPEAVFLDTMPQSYTLLGQHGDGTMGPLGFGKILVASGAFDRCAVRRMYQRFVGRQLDPAAEKLVIDALAKRFSDGGRKVKPFVRYLMSTEEFRRGL